MLNVDEEDFVTATTEAADCVSLRPVGVLRSPHKDVKGMPVQPVGARGVEGHVEVRPDLLEGLRDLDGFSHVILLYHLHRVSGYDLMARPFLDTCRRGVFATRSPRRPNAIGLSVLELAGVDVERGVVRVRNVDILDGSPVLDIKPYVPAFDSCPTCRIGWFEGRMEEAVTHRADGRFRREE